MSTQYTVKNKLGHFLAHPLHIAKAVQEVWANAHEKRKSL